MQFLRHRNIYLELGIGDNIPREATNNLPVVILLARRYHTYTLLSPNNMHTWITLIIIFGIILTLICITICIYNYLCRYRRYKKTTEIFIKHVTSPRIELTERLLDSDHHINESLKVNPSEEIIFADIDQKDTRDIESTDNIFAYDIITKGDNNTERASYIYKLKALKNITYYIDQDRRDFESTDDIFSNKQTPKYDDKYNTKGQINIDNNDKNNDNNNENEKKTPLIRANSNSDLNSAFSMHL